MSDKNSPKPGEAQPSTDDTVTPSTDNKNSTGEVGGRDGLDPTRFGDWEKNGRCIDF